MREQAIQAISQRAGVPRDIAVWMQERPALLGLRESLFALLLGEDDWVKMSVIDAIASLEMDHTKPGNDALQVSVATASRLRSAFERESHDPARARLVHVFAWYQVPPGFVAERNGLVARALADHAAAVVQTAVFAVQNQKLLSFLPTLVNLLSHDSANVRVAVGQAISSFRASARPYLDQLEAALVNESDPLVRRTLEGAISRIRQ